MESEASAADWDKSWRDESKEEINEPTLQGCRGTRSHRTARRDSCLPSSVQSRFQPHWAGFRQASVRDFDPAIL